MLHIYLKRVADKLATTIVTQEQRLEERRVHHSQSHDTLLHASTRHQPHPLQHLCHRHFKQPQQLAPAAREYILTI